MKKNGNTDKLTTHSSHFGKSHLKSRSKSPGKNVDKDSNNMNGNGKDIITNHNSHNNNCSAIDGIPNLGNEHNENGNCKEKNNTNCENSQVQSVGSNIIGE